MGGVAHERFVGMIFVGGSMGWSDFRGCGFTYVLDGPS